MNFRLLILRASSLLFAAMLLVALLPVTAPAAEQTLQISFKPIPDPPRSGDNTVEVTVLDAKGVAVTNATVEVRFFMAAMPTMNMPQMSSTFATKHAEKGRYRGTGKLVMGGTWEVTITVTRDGATLGRRKLTVNARG